MAVNTEAIPQPGGLKEEAKHTLPLLPVMAFVVLWLGGSWAVIGTWLHPVIPGGWMTLAGIVALAVFPIHVLIGGFSRRTYPSAFVRVWVLRPFWYAMLFLPVLAVAVLAAGGIGSFFGAGGSIGRWALAAGSVFLGVAAILGYRDSRRLSVREMKIDLPRLPKAFDGMRIVQISDLHVGPQTSRRFLEQVRHAVQEQKPDLIVITGDQVDDFPQDVEYFNRAFESLQAPSGVIAIAGNHDVYAGWSYVRRGLEDAGFTVLVNESLVLVREEQRLWIAGTGDPAASDQAAPDIGMSLDGIPDSEAVVVLAHNPVLWPEIAAQGADLTLSGHTHYGQFAIPRLGWNLASPFLRHSMGHHRTDNSQLYIHPGTNYWGVPFRLGTPPEVAVITLQSLSA